MQLKYIFSGIVNSLLRAPWYFVKLNDRCGRWDNFNSA